jgi:hypothetical protein
MTSLYLTTALLGLSLAAAIMWLLRRDHLHLGHGLFWLGVAALAAVLGVWPETIDRMATFTGISYPPSLLLLLSVIVLLIKTLHTDMLNTRIERQVKRLNQRLAILDLELQNEKSSQKVVTD